MTGQRANRVTRPAALRRSPGSAADADDIAAEAFARALVRWSTVRDLPHRDAWVVRVASNLAIDSVRRTRRRERILAVQRAAEPVPAGDDAAGDRLALALAVARLPRRQREVITLRYLVGLPEAEVAEALGVSATTVKTHGARQRATVVGAATVVALVLLGALSVVALGHDPDRVTTADNPAPTTTTTTTTAPDAARSTSTRRTAPAGRSRAARRVRTPALRARTPGRSTTPGP